MSTILSYRLVFTALMTLIVMLANKADGTDAGNADQERIESAMILPQDCPGEDYSPCTCTIAQGGFVVTCLNVPLQLIKAVLSQSKTNTLDELHIYADRSDIPENITGGLFIRKIDITYEVPTATYELKCSPSAFTSTANRTETFVLSGWDLSEHDYTYLENFTVLEVLMVGYSDGIFDSWQRLPLLQNLQLIHLTNCQNLGDSNLFPPALPSLQELAIKASFLDDASVASILDGLLSTPYSTQLSRMELSSNLLTVVPSQISSFPNLGQVKLRENFFAHLPAGAFNFYWRAFNIDLSDCEVKTVEQGAFIGNAGDAKIYLNGNELSRFEEDVFLEILQQMTGIRNDGYIDLDANPIDCNTDICHLEWLVVTNRALLDSIANGKCSNGTRIDLLDATAISRACSKDLTSTELSTQQTTSVPITSTSQVSTQKEMTTAEAANQQTTHLPSSTSSAPELAKTTEASAGNPWMSLPPTVTTNKEDRENMTSISEAASSYVTSHSKKPCAGFHVSCYSTGLLVLSWMLIFTAGA